MHAVSKLLFAALVAGCGASNSHSDAGGNVCDGFPTQPFATVSGTQGKLQISVMSTPEQPPAQGVSTLQFVITDTSGQPVTGLTLNVVPWMPAMNHGASVQPSVATCAAGSYVATPVDLVMVGSWQLQTTFTGPVSDDATIAVEIQ